MHQPHLINSCVSTFINPLCQQDDATKGAQPTKEFSKLTEVLKKSIACLKNDAGDTTYEAQTLSERSGPCTTQPLDSDN